MKYVAVIPKEQAIAFRSGAIGFKSESIEIELTFRNDDGDERIEKGVLSNLKVEKMVTNDRDELEIYLEGDYSKLENEKNKVD